MFLEINHGVGFPYQMKRWHFNAELVMFMMRPDILKRRSDNLEAVFGSFEINATIKQVNVPEHIAHGNSQIVYGSPPSLGKVRPTTNDEAHRCWWHSIKSLLAMGIENNIEIMVLINSGCLFHKKFEYIFKKQLNQLKDDWNIWFLGNKNVKDKHNTRNQKFNYTDYTTIYSDVPKDDRIAEHHWNKYGINEHRAGEVSVICTSNITNNYSFVVHRRIYELIIQELEIFEHSTRSGYSGSRDLVLEKILRIIPTDSSYVSSPDIVIPDVFRYNTKSSGLILQKFGWNASMFI